MTENGSLEELLKRARRRHLLNLALSQAVAALSAAVGGLVLLLVLGAQILSWAWIAALFAGATAAGLARILARLPRPYLLLQAIDRRLQLHDTLSTAFYFRSREVTTGASQPMLEAQLRQAERLAREVDPRRAVPIRAPRALYALAALAVAASGLFALRYGVSRRLDLRPPLAAVLFPNPATHSQSKANSKPSRLAERLRQALKRLGVASETLPTRQHPAPPYPVETGDASEVAAAHPPDLSRPIPLSAGSELSADEGAAEATPHSESGAEGADGSLDSDGSTPDRRPPEWANENSNLLQQFREALASLLSRLKSRPATGNSNLSAQARDPGQSARSRQRSSEPGGPGRQSQGDVLSQSDGELDSETAQQAQSAGGKPGGSDSDLEPAREGRSGIGKEDGRKDARQAEQLAAMGKLTELFGRRQATLTGEVMVEVASGTQKLRTPYTEQQARHREAGGEVHRDEIPLLFRHYVQRYFEEVHKLPPPKDSRPPE